MTTTTEFADVVNYDDIKVKIITYPNGFKAVTAYNKEQLEAMLAAGQIAAQVLATIPGDSE